MALRRRRAIWDVVIIGAGFAGLTAAWQTSRRGLSVAVFEEQPACGGQVSTVNTLDDWPATGETSGVELASTLAERLHTEGVAFFHEAVTAVTPGARKDGDKPLVLVQGATEERQLRARRVILASGAKLRTLGVPGEEKLRGKGVSQCAHCDGGFFKGQDVAVIGSGDAAMQEALVLTEMCKTVHVVVRGNLKARRAFSERVDSKTNVKWVWDSEVEEVLGGDAVTGLRLRNVKSGAKSELACAGAFPFVGVTPNGAYLPASVKRDAAGCVITDAQCRTSDAALFAIGALRSGYAGDLVNAVGEAGIAAAVVAAETRI